MDFHFGNRNPRGFHHTFRFTDERRDVLDKLQKGVPPEEVARQSLVGEEAKNGRRQRSGYGLSLAQSGCLATVVLVLLLVFLLALMA